MAIPPTPIPSNTYTRVHCDTLKQVADQINHPIICLKTPLFCDTVENDKKIVKIWYQNPLCQIMFVFDEKEAYSLQNPYFETISHFINCIDSLKAINEILKYGDDPQTWIH